MGRTLTARMPFPRGSSSTSNSTTWPSWSDCTPVGCRALTCTNTSSPCSGAIKPYPRSRLNHFTVPTIAVLSLSLAAARHPTTDARPTSQLSSFPTPDSQIVDHPRVVARTEAVAELPRSLRAVCPRRKWPVGARYWVTSCDPRVLMDQPTETIVPDHPPTAGRWLGRLT